MSVPQPDPSPDEHVLAMVVQAIDDDVGLHAWPMPLNLVRRWAEHVVPTAHADVDPAEPALPWLTVTRVQAVLDRLGQALPCPAGSGWSALVCQTATQRGQIAEATAWVITVPGSLLAGGDRWAAQRAVVRVRDALTGGSGTMDNVKDGTIPPVRYWAAAQRPTGALRATMDDTIDEATVALAAQALREHGQRLAERRALLGAAHDPVITNTPTDRVRSRL